MTSFDPIAREMNNPVLKVIDTLLQPRELNWENRAKWVGERTLADVIRQIRNAQAIVQALNRQFDANGRWLGHQEQDAADLDSRLFDLRREARAMIADLTGYTIDEFVEIGL